MTPELDIAESPLVNPADPREDWDRHRPPLRVIGADWGFVLSPGRGLVLAVAHGGSTLHIPVSTEEAQAVATDLAAACGGQITWAQLPGSATQC